MVPGDKHFWRQIISPALVELVPRVRNIAPGDDCGITKHFVDSLPFEDCGDFVWTLTCISRYAPRDLLESFRYDVDGPTQEARQALLYGALEADDFYAFPKGSLLRLLARLKRNVDSCAEDSPEKEAHTAALKRIEDVIVLLAEEHSSAVEWLKARPKVAIAGASTEAPRRRPGTGRPNHLRLVR